MSKGKNNKNKGSKVNNSGSSSSKGKKKKSITPNLNSPSSPRGKISVTKRDPNNTVRTKETTSLISGGSPSRTSPRPNLSPIALSRSPNLSSPLNSLLNRRRKDISPERDRMKSPRTDRILKPLSDLPQPRINPQDSSSPPPRRRNDDDSSLDADDYVIVSRKDNRERGKGKQEDVGLSSKGDSEIGSTSIRRSIRNDDRRPEDVVKRSRGPLPKLPVEDQRDAKSIRDEIKRSLKIDDLGPNSEYNYRYSIDRKGREFKPGVHIKGQIFKRKDEGIKTLRIREITVDYSSKLQYTLDTLNSMTSDDAIGKIELSLDGMHISNKLIKGLSELDDQVKVNFLMKGSQGGLIKLEQGDKGISQFIGNFSGKPNHPAVKEIISIVEAHTQMKIKKDEGILFSSDMFESNVGGYLNIKSLLKRINNDFWGRLSNEQNAFIMQLNKLVEFEMALAFNRWFDSDDPTDWIEANTESTP